MKSKRAAKKKPTTTSTRVYPSDAAIINDIAHYEDKNAADVVAEAVALLRSKKKGIPVRGSVS